MTLSELRDQFLAQFKMLTWALKVNTAVTGAGLLFVGCAVMYLASVSKTNHQDEMEAIRSLKVDQRQTNTMNVTREPTHNDLVQFRLKQKEL